MKLFVIDSDNKKYLKHSASTRKELAQKIGSNFFTIGNKKFSINDVFAEKGDDSTALSMVLGGAVGLLGGVPGVLIGGALGGIFGADSEKKDGSKVEEFNRS